MIISPSLAENKILLFSENKNEKAKTNERHKIYDKKNMTYKNKTKKEEEKSISNKINHKKNLSKAKENQIKTINSNEIINKKDSNTKEIDPSKSTKNKNKAMKKVVQLKIYNPNQTLDNSCITDRSFKKLPDNQCMTTVATPKKMLFKNIIKKTQMNKLKTLKQSLSLFKDYNTNSNKFINNRNIRLKSTDLKEFYTEKNSDLYLATQNYEYDPIRKYSGKPNYIIKEIDEPSYIKEREITDIFGYGFKTERDRSFNDSLLKEIYKKDLSNYNGYKDSNKNLKSNNTTIFWESMKNSKELNLARNQTYNSSQKNLYFLRKRNKYHLQNISLNSYNCLSISKKNCNNLNKTFYISKSKSKKNNMSLNSTFCETQNIPNKFNLKKNFLFNDSRKKNKSLAPILENEKYHYLQGTICTKNKIVKKSKNFFDDCPTLRKVNTLLDKNEFKGKEKIKPLEKSKNIIHKYNVSPNKRHEQKIKMNNITVRKNNNNAYNNINIKNNIKTKRTVLKNRAASMDNTISNLTTLSNTHMFNGKIEDYLITKELGKGSYAVVKLAKHRKTKEKYAIKIYTKQSLLDPQKRNTVKNEINILKQLNHINIMKLYEVIDSSKYLYLVLEYIKGISLLEVIKMEKYHYIEQHRAIKLFLQILKGISYCQSKNINHRDIKLENILVIKDDIVKIIDFGFSVKGSKETYQKLFCGTPSYMPPEIVNKEKYIAQYSDIWSLGVLLYTMLYGRFPFKAKDDEKLFELINKADVKFPENIFVSEGIKSLIKKILKVEPRLRPSPKEIINEIIFNELSEQ